MKMYILIKDSIETGNAIVSAAHASLAAYLEFKDNPEFKRWLSGSFKKVICQVNEKEFQKAKRVPGSIVITESTLDNAEVAIVFNPREEWPKMFNFFRLYK